MSVSPVRLAIVDDHKTMLDSLTAWLERSTAEIQVAIAVPRCADLFEHPAFPVDVVLLDLDLGDGVSPAVNIAMLRPSGAAIVVVSMFADPAHIRESIGAGALGYVPKTEPAEEIAKAIMAAARGEGYRSPAVARALAGDQARPVTGSPTGPKLSDKETEALVYYASGLPMRSVARTMNIAQDTAKGYIDRVREKYAQAGRDARTKIDLRRRAIEDGIIAGD